VRQIGRGGLRGLAFAWLALGALALGPTAAAALPGPVTLGGGRLGNYLWDAHVGPAESVSEREAGDVCLELTMLEPVGGGRREERESATCRALPTARPWLEGIAGGSGGKVRSALAILFPPAVHTAELNVRGEGVRLFPVRIARLPATFGVAAREVPYLALGYPRKACVEAVRGFDRTGALVASLGRQRCL
jgi:hypothetical protein